MSEHNDGERITYTVNLELDNDLASVRRGPIPEYLKDAPSIDPALRDTIISELKDDWIFYGGQLGWGQQPSSQIFFKKDMGMVTTYVSQGHVVISRFEFVADSEEGLQKVIAHFGLDDTDTGPGVVKENLYQNFLPEPEKIMTIKLVEDPDE